MNLQNTLFTKDRKEEFKSILRTKQKFCIECSRPMTTNHLHCSRCQKKLMTTGFEDSRVKFGEVGRDTVNFQQHLHRKFFGCNVSIEYRGNLKDRIYNCLDEDTINRCENMLDRLLTSNEYTYLNKKYNINNKFSELYVNIRAKKNVTRRLLYNITLYFISYYINKNKSFATEIHFQISMLSNIFINIQTINLRLNGSIPKDLGKYRRTLPMKYYTYLLERIEYIIQPILHKLYRD